MKYETRDERMSEDERLTERFTRRETETQRWARIKRLRVSPETTAALRMLFAA